MCQPVGHINSGVFKMITDSIVWSIICKGPKYRFLSPIYFNKCREEIGGSLQEFCKLCKREHVDSNALNTWRLNIFLTILIVEFHVTAII